MAGNWFSNIENYKLLINPGRATLLTRKLISLFTVLTRSSCQQLLFFKLFEECSWRIFSKNVVNPIFDVVTNIFLASRKFEMKTKKTVKVSKRLIFYLRNCLCWTWTIKRGLISSDFLDLLVLDLSSDWQEGPGPAFLSGERPRSGPEVQAGPRLTCSNITLFYQTLTRQLQTDSYPH